MTRPAANVTRHDTASLLPPRALLTNFAPPRRFAACFVVWLMASYAIALSHAQLFDPDTAHLRTGAYRDPLRYVGMVEGIDPGGHWRYRVLVPGMARAIPAAPLRVVSTRPAISDAWLASVRLLFVNVLFLTLTGATLFVLLMRLGFSHTESLLGTLLFYTAFPVVQAGGVPSVDPASWFFFALAAYAIATTNLWLLAAAFAVGIYAKESVLLALPLVVLAPFTWRARAALLAATAPGVLLYLAVRFVWLPAPGDYLPAAAAGARGAERAWAFVVSVFTRPNRLIDLLSSFGLLWVPAVASYSRGEGPPLLRRWALFVPLLALAILYLGLNLGRILFLAFPIVIPFALLGLRYWWRADDPGGRTPARAGDLPA